MSKDLSILFVTSEVLPFVKVGGLSDVSFSLPLALRDIGHDVRVMLPKYGSVSERKNKIHEINRLRDVAIPINKSMENATVKSSSINNPRSKVQAYVTTNHKYFDSKKGIYSDLKLGKPYPDNDERFMFFSRSVLVTCMLLGWYPDVIHCNDWQTAMVPVFAKTLYPEEFKNTRFVFTIHNFHEHGEFPPKTFEKLRIPDTEKDNLFHKKKVNYLKAGIYYSDFVTTVSESYAKDMLEDTKLSNGLDVYLKQKGKKFKGILNGIDNWIWNPRKDKLIPKKYNKNYDDYKDTNREKLIEAFELEADENVPIIAMISRLDEHKGISLLLKTADKLLHENIRFLLLGTGEIEVKSKIKAIAKQYPDKFKVHFGLNEELAHLIEAGADFILMPALTEACGLNSMYSLNYGTIPIVRGVGGLKDIVIDLNKENGNGIVFEKYSSTDLMSAIKRAIELRKDYDKYKQIAEKNMDLDFSWKQNSSKYDEIYQNLLKSK